MFFHNRIIVHPLPDGINWITEDWVALSFSDKSIFVPKGFKTDFGSISRFLWFIVGAPATGKHRRAVIYHDWLYATQRLTRKESDYICLEIMKFDKTNFISKYLIYFGVRIGGFIAWNRKTNESKENYIVEQRKQFENNFLNETHVIFA